jgi:hypothetical protein
MSEKDTKVVNNPNSKPVKVLDTKETTKDEITQEIKYSQNEQQVIKAVSALIKIKGEVRASNDLVTYAYNLALAVNECLATPKETGVMLDIMAKDITTSYDIIIGAIHSHKWKSNWSGTLRTKLDLVTSAVKIANDDVSVRRPYNITSALANVRVKQPSAAVIVDYLENS